MRGHGNGWVEWSQSRKGAVGGGWGGGGPVEDIEELEL